ncbi:hypothetical protein AGMMS50255_8850 [Spirochaetia bacterium]|nr:hypothetical protein AGMMS50255_8850 [Spirochaetia bacterium]
MQNPEITPEALEALKSLKEVWRKKILIEVAKNAMLEEGVEIDKVQRFTGLDDETMNEILPALRREARRRYIQMRRDIAREEAEEEGREYTQKDEDNLFLELFL